MNSSELYNKAFYDKQSHESFKSAEVVLDVVLQAIPNKVKSIVDFGCGVGPWLAAAKQLGVNSISGTDGDYVPRDHLLIDPANFTSNNLSKPASVVMPKKRYDLAMSLEVAEHLPFEEAASFVSMLCQHSDLILFSAAIPYQGGHGHVNENWQQYWANLFSGNNFFPVDLVRKKIWNNKSVAWWYKQNILLYVNKTSKFYRLFEDDILLNNDVLNIVHPEQFLLANHRENFHKHRTFNRDKMYLTSLCDENKKEVANPQYGPEFSYVEKEIIPINSVDELKSRKDHFAKPVVKDACNELRLKGGFQQLFLKSNKLICMPDFLCIGAQKSATTWLYQFLQGQKLTWVPQIKELNFFNSLVFQPDSAYSGAWRRDTALIRLKQALANNPDIHEGWLNSLVHLTRRNLDIDWYQKIYKDAPEGTLKGDITPEYSMLPPEAIRFIYEQNPKIKIIFMVKKPAERAFSHLMMIKRNAPELTENALIELSNSESVSKRSQYNEIIRVWSSVIPESQIFVDSAERLAIAPLSFITDLEEFLGTDFDNHNLLDKKVHQNDYESSEYQDLKRILSEQYRQVESEFLDRYPKLSKYWASFVPS